LAAAERNTALVAILKTSQMRVRLAGATPGWEPYEFPTGFQPLPAPRAVAYLQPVDAGSAPAQWPRVSILPNNPQWTAQQFVSVVRQAEAWQANIDVFVESVRGGELEKLRWEASSELASLPRMMLPGKLEWLNIPGQTRRHLVANLAVPKRDAFHVRLTIPLGGAPGERLQIPDLRLLDAASVATFVILPGKLELQQIDWDTRGLQATELPPERRVLSPLGAQSYVAVGPRFQASVRRVERGRVAPRIDLAELLVMENTVSGSYGLASFELLPAGLTHCRLAMPPGSTLVQATVAGHPAVLSRSDDTHWQFMLHHEELPQRINLLYTTAPPAPGAADGARTLHAPMLENIPVQRTLWTVSTPMPKKHWSLADSRQVVSPWQQTLLRLKGSSDVLKQAAGPLTENDPAQIPAWFMSWARHNRRAHADYDRLVANNDEPARELLPEMEAVALEQQAIARQFGAGAVLAQAQAERGSPDSLDDIAAAHLRRTGSAGELLMAQSDGPLKLRTARARSLAWAPSVLAAVVIVVVAVAIQFARRSSAVQDLVAAWPQALGILAGVVWWLWLTPAVLGLFIALIFALAPLRWYWPASRPLADTGFSLRSSVRRVVSYRES
jgi:hypothetical protein